MERNPLGSITKKKISKLGKKIDVWDVRKQYRDGVTKTGKPRFRSLSKRCYSYADAVTALQNLPLEIEEKLADEHPTAENRTFLDLSHFFRVNEIKSPIYIGKRKISGYKQNLDTLRKYCTEFETFFGHKLLTEICYDDIRRFAERIATTLTQKKSLPSASTINQRLGLLRRIFQIGLQLNWIEKSPFSLGSALIHKSAVTKRNRMLTFEEESRLLAECVDQFRYIKSFILLSLDTGMRRGEIYQLEWSQIDFENKVIYLTDEFARETKTGVEGILPLTSRLEIELELLKKSAKNSKVIGKIDFKKGWKKICANANIKNLQFRDLRATGATRMMLAGNSGDLVRKITRHTETETFFEHYTGVDISNAQIIGQKLQDFIENQVTKAKAKAKVKNEQILQST